MTYTNQLVFGGELVSLKNLSNEFGASIKIRGTSKRYGESASQIAEVTFLIPKDVYEDFVRRGVEVYDKVSVSCHIETWRREYQNKIKQMFIVDELKEVSKKMERNRF